MQRGFLDTRVLFGLFSIFIVFVLIFGFTRAKGILYGPQITLYEDRIYSSIDEGFITLEGTVERNAYFSINGMVVAPEQNGNFSERLYVTPGHTIMTIQARDRFERSTEEIISIYVPEYASEEETSSREETNQGGSEGGEEFQG
ncbi:MAG: hypothetical protein ACJKSS_01135 [Patescibacteria group bacterium UBA2103]